MKEAAEKEWISFRDERKAGIEEITNLRRRVAEEEDRKKTEQPQHNPEHTENTNTASDVKMDDDEALAQDKTEATTTVSSTIKPDNKEEPTTATSDQPSAKDMDVDDDGARTDGSKTLESDSTKGSTSAVVPPPSGEAPPASERKEEPTLMQADEDDAVEY